MDKDLMAKINELETATLNLISVLEYKETHEVTYALNELNCAVFLIEEVKNHTDLTSEDKLESIIQCYDNLFPPHGGFTDYFIWRDNYNERVRINNEYLQALENCLNVVRKIRE